MLVGLWGSLCGIPTLTLELVLLFGGHFERSERNRRYNQSKRKRRQRLKSAMIQIFNPSGRGLDGSSVWMRALESPRECPCTDQNPPFSPPSVL